MDLERHLEELKRKHFELDEIIYKEQKQPAFSGMEIRKLKKKKLYIKDRIEKVLQRIPA